MSKITPILAGAALAAAIGAWNSPSARADVNIGLYVDGTGAQAVTVAGGSQITVDVIATFPSATGVTGMMDLDGAFTANQPNGSYAMPTLDSNFTGSASTVGTNVGAINGGWGVDSMTGTTPNFVAARSNVIDPTYAVLVPMTTPVTMGSVTGILVAQVVYTVPTTGGVTLNFVPNNDAGLPSVIWVENMDLALTGEPNGGLANMASPGSGDALGTATTSPLVINGGGVVATTSVWGNGVGDGDWSKNGNWAAGSVPTVGAIFDGTNAAGTSGVGNVSLTAANTSINTITFSAATQSYTISPSVSTNTLTLGATAPGNITVNSPGTTGATHTISARFC